jgi:hypothetical protein
MYSKKRYFSQFILVLLSAMLLNLGQPLVQLWAQDGGKIMPDVSPRETQIVGGQPADAGEWPWQVRLHLGNGLCGGSLIHSRWVLTAAHCVEDGIQLSEITVFLGEHDYDVDEGTEQTRGVVQIVRHPQYLSSGYTDDIALLKLDSPAILNEWVQLVPFAANNEMSPGTIATVTGWGTLEEGGEIPSVLYEVSVPIVSRATCQATQSNDLTDGMLCAGYEEGGKDSCQGDSGGPLVVSTGEGWKVAGVVSFGTGCARPNQYGVYTSVPYYADWIHQILNSATGPTPLINVDFEQGPSNGWREESSKNLRLIADKDLPVSPRSGSFIGWLGGDNSETSILAQVAVLNERTTELRFYYRISSDEIGCEYDEAGIFIAGALVEKLGLCNANETADWAQKVIDLRGYAGLTVDIQFATVTDSSIASSFFVDDVSIISDAPSPLTVSSISPVWGDVGTAVTVNGTHLFDTSAVLFNGTPATYTVESDTQLIATVPAGSSSGKIEVRTNYGTAKSLETFTLAPQLSVQFLGSGAGSVTSIPAGIACTSACNKGFEPGVEITLTATPTATSEFVGWAGACSGTELTCVVTVDRAKTAIAAFNLIGDAPAQILSVVRQGEGSVTSTPPGITCGNSCAAVISLGTPVTLTAQSADFYAFDGWAGACTGAEATCSLTLDAATVVTATFTSNAGLLLPMLNR